VSSAGWLLLLCLCCVCLAVVLNANRHVTGTLRGFDQFMNVVLDQTVDMKTKTDIGMVVSCSSCTPLSFEGVRKQCQQTTL
jgi:small nuclear ribonucleoprotein (snRNP)-like protein